MPFWCHIVQLTLTKRNKVLRRCLDSLIFWFDMSLMGQIFWRAQFFFFLTHTVIFEVKKSLSTVSVLRAHTQLWQQSRVSRLLCWTKDVDQIKSIDMIVYNQTKYYKMKSICFQPIAIYILCPLYVFVIYHYCCLGLFHFSFALASCRLRRTTCH